MRKRDEIDRWERWERGEREIHRHRHARMECLGNTWKVMINDRK